jgi:16S rRNA processing protein RimM
MEYTEIGYTLKPHGLAGEIKIFVQEQWEEAIEDLEMVYLEIKGRKVPYFLDQVRGGGALIASFEDIDDRDAALVISSKPMFARSSDLPAPTPVQTVQIPDFVGYQLLNEHDQSLIGTITDIIEYPHQIMAVLDCAGKEVIIPLAVQYVKSEDVDKRILVVDLPEGLLDL